MVALRGLLVLSLAVSLKYEILPGNLFTSCRMKVIDETLIDRLELALGGTGSSKPGHGGADGNRTRTFPFDPLPPGRW